jgi:hypothetical protein
MGYSINAEIDVNTPGVTTFINQTLDLDQLDSAQWTRLCNAAKSGLVTGGRGYLALLTKALAKEINVLHPFIISTSGAWQGIGVEHPWMESGSIVHDKIDELMQLSKVRARMQIAANPSLKGNYQLTREPTRHHSGWRSGAYVTLPGWSSSTDVRKFLTKELCKRPEMVESREQLLAYINTKPSITIVTREF